MGFLYIIENCINLGFLIFHFIFLFLERKGSNFVVRSDAKVNQVLKSGAVRKHELLIPNAVAVSYLITLTPF
jgi:hypothetical protein